MNGTHLECHIFWFNDAKHFAVIELDHTIVYGQFLRGQRLLNVAVALLLYTSQQRPGREEVRCTGGAVGDRTSTESAHSMCLEREDVSSRARSAKSARREEFMLRKQETSQCSSVCFWLHFFSLCPLPTLTGAVNAIHDNHIGEKIDMMALTRSFGAYFEYPTFATESW